MKMYRLLITTAFVCFSVLGMSKQLSSKFDSLLRSAPLVADSIPFLSFPQIEIDYDTSIKVQNINLYNNNSLIVRGKLEVEKIVIESGSISSITSSGTCIITGDLYLKKNSTLAIEGNVEVFGNVISEENTGLIMHAGSLLQVGGNMEGSVSTHIIGSGKVSVKGFVSGGFMNNSIINKVWPYELIHFSSLNTGNSIELKWATMSEFICKEFIIQKSSDGLLFEDSFVVSAYGNENTINYYSIIDGKPFKGVNYYRLKQINSAGRSGHSEVISSFVPSPLEDLHIVSKPIFNAVDVYYPEQEYSQISIRLEDAEGNIQVSETEYVYPYFSINTSAINTGIYYIAIEIDGVEERRPVSIIN